GLAYWASGDLKAAHRTFSAGLAGMTPLEVIVGTFVLADIKMTLGHLHEAVHTCEYALQLAAEHGEPFPMGTEDVYTSISALHRELGDLETAVQELTISKKLGKQVELPDWQYRWCIAQARLNETLGDLDGSLDLLDEAESVFVRTPLPKVHPIPAMKARVWVKQGKLAEALGWAREWSLSVADDLSFLREFEHITLARLFIAQYKSDMANDSIHEAMELLTRLLQAAEEGGRMGSVIEILALQALAHETQGDISPALVPLERALALAKPKGYIRIFVDEGLPMAKLLQEAANQHIEPDYTRKLLAAFKPYIPNDTSAPSQPLIEPLSKRELEVLQLVAQGLTNRQISERLFLALDTVKGHNRRIFGKLGVKNRAQAVNKAISLKILPPQ
ncbi:MAG: response regulator transcription factor, partial [Chloroflexi bacterium]|nr:response regulator transcription factor [Chloroflexota bacterium]